MEPVVAPEAVAPLLKKIRDSFEGKRGVAGWESYTRHEGKGYCGEGTSWFFSFEEARKRTGVVPGERLVPSGAMHPNVFGHLFYGTKVCEAVVSRMGTDPRSSKDAIDCHRY